MTTESYKTDKRFVRAREYATSDRPDNEIEEVEKHGEWAFGYAEQLYIQSCDVFSVIDSKARSVVMYLGCEISLLAVVIALKASEHAIVVTCMLAPLFVSLLGILYAIMARIPINVPGFPAIDRVVAYLAEYGSKAKAEFLGQMHVVCVGIDVVNEKKSHHLEKAMKCQIAATWMILFPLFAVLVLAQGRP